ncbi:MAG: hypothetical protein H6726_10665 [Sandaracinaceae bacterium]|nr:hypothetical protein [Sandaracinaceae bacterium]
MRHAPWIAVLALFSTSFAACSAPFDTERRALGRGTIGAEIYKVVCQRFSSEALPSDVSGGQTRALCAGEAPPESAPSPQLRALAENRTRLITALDATFPEALEDDLDTLLLDLLPLYDRPDEQLPNTTRGAASLVYELMSDEAVLTALEQVGVRRGYRPLRRALGVARPVLAYDDFQNFATTVLATIDEGGAAHDEYRALVEALAADLAVDDPVPEPTGDGRGTLAVARELMLSHDDAYGPSSPVLIPQRDARGMAVPAALDGSLGFVDLDADGLADVDDEGRYLDASGAPLSLPAPFALLGEPGAPARDADERALDDQARPLFAYHELNRTLLAGLARDVSPLLDPDQPGLLDTLRGLPVLLGPNTDAQEQVGAITLDYAGYDDSQGALRPLVHALAPLLSETETADAIAALEVLLRDHEGLVAGLVHAGHVTDARSDLTPRADLVEGSELWDDVIQVAQWIVQEPGLLEALLRALADPQARRFGQIFAEMMTYKDYTEGPPANDVNLHLADQDWAVTPNRNAPDARGNQSVFQQTISAIHDLGYVSVCNKANPQIVLQYRDIFGNPQSITLPLNFIGECDLFRIEDVAETYALSLIGEATLPLSIELFNDLLNAPVIGPLLRGIVNNLLQALTGIDGLTTSPTPYALNRLVFVDSPVVDGLIDPPLTRDGQLFKQRHGPVVFAWEREYHFCNDVLIPYGAPCNGTRDQTTFLDAAQPLIRAFHQYDRRTGGRFLFTELISALHLHWPTTGNDMVQGSNPNAPAFAHRDGGVNYEPIVATLFADCVGAPGACSASRGAQFITRLHELGQVLDGIEVRPGVDGIDALAALGERLIDPARNTRLRNLDGTGTTRTNGGRSIPVTPLYQLLDALAGIDALFEPEADRHESWLAGRSALVDAFGLTTRTSVGHRFDNPHTPPALRALTALASQRIEAHRDGGDLVPWAAGLDERMSTSLGSAVSTAALRFLEAIQADEDARRAFAHFLAYLMDDEAPYESFAVTVAAIADLMQVLDDDAHMDPILTGLSEALAIGVRDAAENGGDVNIDGSTLDRTLALLREINERDANHTITRVLQNLVSLPPAGPAETPLETIIEVVAEVNRQVPNEGGSMSAADHFDVFESVHHFLTGEIRGIERIYQVVQNREIAE